jgi:hypothetical protein
VGKPIGKQELHGELYAATHPELAQAAYIQDFLATVRAMSFKRLSGLMPLKLKSE